MIRNCFFLTMSIALNVSAAPTSLKIQDVADMALNKGLYQKDIELNYQKSEISLLLSEANFDTQFGIKGQKEDSRVVAPGALVNPRDQTQSIGLGLSRKFTTGSMLGIDYSYAHRESDLSNFMKSAGISPIQYFHLGQYKDQITNGLQKYLYSYNIYYMSINIFTKLSHH